MVSSMASDDLRNAVRESKKIMRYNGSGCYDFTKYSQFYFRTNENIKMSLEDIDFNKERTLSVMASGDQVFNLIYLGAEQIDTFDINLLSYYVFELRRAIFLAYSYEKSQKIEKMFSDDCSNSQKLFEILNTLKLFMSPEAYLYFKSVLKYNIRLSNSVDRNRNFFQYMIREAWIYRGTNLYDESKSYFRRFQNNLELAKVSFKNCDIAQLPDFLEGEYGLMYLSNIVSYFASEYGMKKFMDLMMKLYPHLCYDGVIINYFFGEYSVDAFKNNLEYLDNLGFQGETLVRERSSKYASFTRKKR